MYEKRTVGFFSLASHALRACEARALRARKTLTPRFTDFSTDFEKKTDCFAVYKGFGLPIPRAVAFWVADFLTHRQQRAKMSGDCFSEWGPVPDGVPQGTKLVLSLFLRVPRLDIWKYVDGTIIPFFEEPNQ